MTQRPAVFLLLLFSAAILQAADATVRFDPSAPEVGPFPSDALTVPDAAQKTGKRIQMPLPDCLAQPSTCQELRLLNQLDGFNVTPRLAVRFSAPIQPDSIRTGIALVALDNLTSEEYGLNRDGEIVSVNQVIFDPQTNTAYAKPDSFLDQHRRFLLVVTNAVLDSAGRPAVADPAYTACIAAPSNEYCAALARAVGSVAGRFGEQRIVAASVFTTQSATAWMEGARAALRRSATSFERANYVAFDSISDAVFQAQTGTNPAGFTSEPLPISLLQSIRGLSFGYFRSPHFLKEQRIAQTPTAAPVELPADSTAIAFHAFLPSVPKPAAGYPVVIFGHGLTDNRFVGPSAMASTLAAAGFVSVAFNAVGHGFGPQSKLLIKTNAGSSIEIAAPGRGVDMDNDGTIGDSEGCLVVAPAPVGLRDCLRQTALDQMQLVRAIQAGIDLDGDGAIDLDASRIYYVGQSLGAMYGTLFNAIEPEVAAAVLNSGGGTVIDLARSSITYRSLAATFAAARVPALLNKGGDFDDNYVLRYQPAKVNNVAGAIDLQNFFERLEWLQASGDPVNYAPHLKSSTLPGVPIKSVLWGFGRGDQSVPNQVQTALVRAANMRESTWIYRHDIAQKVIPQLPANPHAYLLNVLSLPTLAVALPAQSQAAAFLASGGTAISDPNNALLRAIFNAAIFETPAFLPEDPGY
jgi:dienelactone hydrolase